MKILLISDTHGVLDRIYEVHRKHTDIDTIIHLGDHADDAISIDKRLDKTVHYVLGNCDGAATKEESSKILNTPYGKLLLTHGHADGVNYDITNLFYRAKELDCKAALFGHTHVPYNEELEGIKLVNPGSLTRPKDGSDGSYAIIEITENSMDVEILYYKKKQPVPEGGYIRSLINYSDRF